MWIASGTPPVNLWAYSLDPCGVRMIARTDESGCYGTIPLGEAAVAVNTLGTCDEGLECAAFEGAFMREKLCRRGSSVR